jgi:hypothetical protein
VLGLNNKPVNLERLYSSAAVFNAKDYLALINLKGGEKKPVAKKKPKR